MRMRGSIASWAAVVAGLLAGCSSPGGDLDAAVDADPRTTIPPGAPFVLSPGNTTGQDEDPAVARRPDGSLVVAWYSNRNGVGPDGRADKEIFVVGSDGAGWSAPVQATDDPAWAFYPALTSDDGGAVHMAWWRVILQPPGCTPGVDCTGTDNRIEYQRSGDGTTWGAGLAEVTAGPGDWLPSIVVDRRDGRVLIYFAAVARADDGSTDLAQRRSRIFQINGNDGDWHLPVRVADLDDGASHATYPHVVQRDDGSLVMTWTRYDGAAPGGPLDPLSQTSTTTMVSTSTDGLSWSAPRVAGGNGTTVDVFPWLYADHAGGWYVSWLQGSGGGAAVVECPLDDVLTGQPVPAPRPELTGYTARVVATATPGVFLGAWVEGTDPTQKIMGRFFRRN